MELFTRVQYLGPGGQINTVISLQSSQKKNISVNLLHSVICTMSPFVALVYELKCAHFINALPFILAHQPVHTIRLKAQCVRFGGISLRIECDVNVGINAYYYQMKTQQLFVFGDFKMKHMQFLFHFMPHFPRKCYTLGL